MAIRVSLEEKGGTPGEIATYSSDGIGGKQGMADTNGFTSVITSSELQEPTPDSVSLHDTPEINIGVSKTGQSIPKTKGFKAGFKINQLADMLAKRSMNANHSEELAPAMLSLPTESSGPLEPASPHSKADAPLEFENSTKELSETRLLPLPSFLPSISLSVNGSPSPPPITPEKLPQNDESAKTEKPLSELVKTAEIEEDESRLEPPSATALCRTNDSTKLRTRSSQRCRKKLQTAETDVPRRARKNKQSKAEISAEISEGMLPPAIVTTPPDPPQLPVTPPKFICLFCQLTFIEKTDCLNHEATHTLKRKTKFIKCQFCSRKLPNLEDFKSHCSKHHSSNFHLCSECDLRFYDEACLQHHTKQDHNTAERTHFNIFNKKVKIGNHLDIDVNCDPTKKPLMSPRGIKVSPKEKSEEQLYEAEMLFYSHLSGNIQENLSNHLDGKIYRSEVGGEPSESSGLLTVAPSVSVPVCRAPSPYQTRSKTPNPLPTSAKKFKKLPNWQQKFWEKYNFPTSYRFEHRFWDKNYINTEKSPLYLKDLSCLDIKTQLTMRENVKKLEKSTEKEADTQKGEFPFFLGLVPVPAMPAVEPSPPSLELVKVPKKKGREAKLPRRSRQVIENNGLQVVTRRQSVMDVTKQSKNSADGGERKMTLRRQASAEIVAPEVAAKEKQLSDAQQNEPNGEEEGAYVEKSDISGEWVRPRSYLCGACCAKFASLWDLEDHKWALHPNVWCTHYEFEVDKVEKLFHLEDEQVKVAKIKLTDLYRRHLSVEGTLDSATPIPGTSYPHPCSKCQKSCQNQADLHRHMLDCGGDTTWSQTMCSSPAILKRRWRAYGSRRRKPTAPRGFKRAVTATPPPRNYITQPKVRTKPGDVESIQKMLANLPEKRTRRAINFDEVNTRSQATIHSNRLLRKRLNGFGIHRQAIKGRPQQKSSGSNTPQETPEVSDAETSSRKKFRLKEVTVNVTPLTLPSSPVVKEKPKATKKKVKKELNAEEEAMVTKKKLVKQKGLLIRNIKRKLSTSKKIMDNRRRSHRIKENKSEDSLPVAELKAPEEKEENVPVLNYLKSNEKVKRVQRKDFELLPKQTVRPTRKRKIVEEEQKEEAPKKVEEEAPCNIVLKVLRKKRGKKSKQKVTIVIQERSKIPKEEDIKSEPSPAEPVTEEIPQESGEKSLKKGFKLKGRRRWCRKRKNSTKFVKKNSEELSVPSEEPSPPEESNALIETPGPASEVVDEIVVEPKHELYENLTMEKIISDKLNERIVKRKNSHRHEKCKNSLKNLKMTFTLKEATLKVLDKPNNTPAPSKWTSTVATLKFEPPAFGENLEEREVECKSHSKENIPGEKSDDGPQVAPMDLSVKSPLPKAEPMAGPSVMQFFPVWVSREDVSTTVPSSSSEGEEPVSAEASSTSQVKSIVPIFITVEEATSSEDAVKPCVAKIAEADSTEKEAEVEIEVSSSEVKSEPEMVVSSTTKKRRKRNSLIELDCKDEVPSSTLQVPEELDRRSRRKSKEVPSSGEFVIDDPLLLVDELWSDLDSDSDTKKKKVKRVKKKSPKKKSATKNDVDLEALLRNFGEKKDGPDVKILPKKRKRRKVVNSRQKIENKMVFRENAYRRLSLKLFSFNKKVLRYGHHGSKLLKVKKAIPPQIRNLPSEILENPEQIIVCHSSKPKKKVPKDAQFKVSLPLEKIGDLTILNNNHLQPISPPLKPETQPSEERACDGKQKRSEIIDKIFFCEPCQTYYYTASNLRNHKQTNRHKQKLLDMGLEAEVDQTEQPKPELSKVESLPEQADEESQERSEEPAEPEEIASFEDRDDSSEMPVLEGPFIENRDPVMPELVAPAIATPSAFSFSEASLKRIQKTIGCTDEEMLILTLLGENSNTEPNALNLEAKPERNSTNGGRRIDLKQRMTTALACLVSRAVKNLLSKTECSSKNADKTDTMAFLNKLSLLGKQPEATAKDPSTDEKIVQPSEDVKYRFECKYCGNRFEKASTRDYHIHRTHHKRKQPEKQDLDDALEDWRQFSESEDNDITPSSQFLCCECGIYFLSPKEVLDHQKTEHPGESSKDKGTVTKQRRLSALDPEKERLIANQELQKLSQKRKFPANYQPFKKFDEPLSSKKSKNSQDKKTVLDIYDFDESEDTEPVVLTHVRKTAITKETADEDSEDNLPLSSVKLDRKQPSPVFEESLSKTELDSQSSKSSEENPAIEKSSFKVSLENRLLCLDDVPLKKFPMGSDDDSVSRVDPTPEESDEEVSDNVIFQRNDSESSEESSKSEMPAEIPRRRQKRILPTLSATLDTGLINSSWEPEGNVDVDKEAVMNKVWRKKREDNVINQTEISSEVVIHCGPKEPETPEESPKNEIVRKIWSGRCGFQTKAALKTYDSDLGPPPETPLPSRRRARTSTVSPPKRKKPSSSSEDDLDSLLKEIEQENVEKAIRCEFLHLRRAEKNLVDAPKEVPGLFAETQPPEVEKRKRKPVVRRAVEISRRHKKHRHRHHHHKHRHKRSRHRKNLSGRSRRRREEPKEAAVEAPFRVLERMCEDIATKQEDPVETWAGGRAVIEPRISTDLDNLDLKLDEILSPLDSAN